MTAGKGSSGAPRVQEEAGWNWKWMDKILECTWNALQPLKVNLIWLPLNVWMLMPNCSGFQCLYVSHAILSQKSNHTHKCPIHESTTKCPACFSASVSPLHHLIMITMTAINKVTWQVLGTFWYLFNCCWLLGQSFVWVGQLTIACCWLNTLLLWSLITVTWTIEMFNETVAPTVFLKLLDVFFLPI